MSKRDKRAGLAQRCSRCHRLGHKAKTCTRKLTRRSRAVKVEVSSKVDTPRVSVPPGWEGLEVSYEPLPRI